MRLRSTGLGKTELVAEVESLTPQKGSLILSIRAIQPVSWHIRASMGKSDTIRLLKLLLRLSVIKHILLLLFSKSSKEETLIDF